MKRIIAIIGLVVAATAFAAVTTTYRSVQRIGPYYSSVLGYDSSAAGGGVGGAVHIFRDSGTLLVGDVVFLSARNTVLKSATLANYNAIAGVVVGGTKTNMQAVTSKPGATDTASIQGQQVLVMSRGRTWIRIDAAAGIAPGFSVIPSATVAGAAVTRGTAIDTFNRAFAKLIDTGIVSSRALALVNVKP